MRSSFRPVGRPALAGLLAAAALATGLSPARAAAPPEKGLPDSTILFIKVADAAALRDALGQSQAGQLAGDPALKPLKDDVAAKLDDVSTKLKEKVGVTLGELATLPQGEVTLAVVAKADPKSPAALLISADAGKNAAKMAEVMDKATKQAEQAGGKVSTETFKDLTLHTIVSPKEKDADGDKPPPPPLVWTNAGSVYHIGTDVAVLKDFLGQSGSRTDSLAANESYMAIQKKLGAESKACWFIDIARMIKLVISSGAAANGGANAQQAEAILQITGVNNLKAAGGTYNLNVGGYDSISKTYFLSPGPAQGLLKVFQMPKANLRPQAWVPAGVASYQSLSWDIDGAYNAINDLANMFNPGILGVLEQQLVGPDGGDPVSFQKDIFGPLGDRLTVISDFKKPLKDDSQRVLFGVALEDPKAFQNTLNKAIGLAKATPKKRDFQGTTIYDFALPETPAANNGASNPFKGPISVTIAKETLFVATEPALLEQVLRGSGQSLADNPAFQAVAKEVPDQTSTLSYVKPEESARQSYEMFKSGQFEKALAAGAAAGGPDMSKLGALIDKDKLPDFEVFAKYLSQSGGYGLMEDDGMTFTTFTLRKANP